MKLFILLSFILTASGTAALGLRLALSGLKSRKVPELAYGASLLFSASGTVMRLVVVGILGGGPEHIEWLTAAGALRLVTLVALTLGLKVIYRPQSPGYWAPVLGLCCFGLWALWLVIAHPMAAAEVGPIYFLGDLPASLATIWGALESFSYYRKMRRRTQLGLADPLVTQQFKLWGTAFTCGACAGMFLVAAGLITGAAVTKLPLVLGIIQLLMLGMTVFTWWAFYPPQWLRRRVSGSAPPASEMPDAKAAV